MRSARPSTSDEPHPTLGGLDVPLARSVVMKALAPGHEGLKAEPRPAPRTTLRKGQHASGSRLNRSLQVLDLAVSGCGPIRHVGQASVSCSGRDRRIVSPNSLRVRKRTGVVGVDLPQQGAEHDRLGCERRNDSDFDGKLSRIASSAALCINVSARARRPANVRPGIVVPGPCAGGERRPEAAAPVSKPGFSVGPVAGSRRRSAKRPRRATCVDRALPSGRNLFRLRAY